MTPLQKKVAMKRVLRVTFAKKQRAAEARRRFIKSVAETQPTVETERHAQELVQFTRAAKEASFLDQYKIAA